MALGFKLYAAAVLAPGVNSLAQLLALRSATHSSASAALDLPSPNVLPVNERRRASRVVRLALACIEQALETSPFAAAQLRMVFASDEGTGEVCQQMLETLATTRCVSPLLFHNSVHNAPSGYWSIGYQNRQSATSVSLGSESFAAGLLCAVTEVHTSDQPVLFVAYDAPIAPPMQSLLPIEHATATAWIIGSTAMRAARPAELGSFELSLHARDPGAGETRSQWLPAAWAINSSAQGFEVLALLADGGSCELSLGAQNVRVACVHGTARC